MIQQGMGQMPYLIKDSKVRMEFKTRQQKGAMAMLLLPDKSKMIVILEAMQSYMAMNMEKFTSDKEYSRTEMIKTTQTKTIAGHQCTVWIMESPDNNVEACMAEGLGTFVMPKSPMTQQQTPGWPRS